MTDELEHSRSFMQRLRLAKKKAHGSEKKGQRLVVVAVRPVAKTASRHFVNSYTRAYMAVDPRLALLRSYTRANRLITCTISQ